MLLFVVVVVAESMLPKGSTIHFTLMVSNFLGVFAKKEFSVKKLGYPAPVVSLQGTNPQSTTHSDELILRANAALPEMSCVETSLTNSKMSYEWSELTGQYSGTLSTTNPRVLRIPAGELQATKTYAFRCFVALTSNAASNNSATVAVYVKQQSILANIAGGSMGLLVTSFRNLNTICLNCGRAERRIFLLSMHVHIN